ncbi:MAG: HD domain-containing protein [Burkholderiales bacterium]|nr:HD domain-containing protein [Burkholderiales bacterium]
MSISELALNLDAASRSTPQSSDPRIRQLLSKLRPFSSELFNTPSGAATTHFRSIGRSLVRLRGSANASLRLDLLQECCHHLYLAGGADDLITFAEHGVELAKRAGKESDVRRFYAVLGIAYADIGDRGKGVEFTSRALAIATKLSDRFGQYVAWSNLSVVLVDSGLYSEGIACASRALELIDSHDSNARDYRARVLTNTSIARFHLGDYEEAERFAYEAVSLSEEPTSLRSTIMRLIRELNLVLALVANQHYAEARKHARYMQHIAASFPSPRAEGIANLCDGLTEFYVGDSVRAVKAVEDVVDKSRGGLFPIYVDALSVLSRLYTDLNRPTDALRILDELHHQVTSVRSESVVSQLRAIGDHCESIERALKRNQREHERMHAELRAKVMELEVSRSRQEMLERMAVAADIREDISGEHGYRVGRLSALLAKEIGWDRESCNALDIAARLHDIGKIGIPERILLDDKTLKEAEKHFIASHTLVGAEILSKSDIPQVRIAEEIARCHHEWWDGSGYPKKMQGVAIPKGARIVALADVFDAMTHGRPYAKAIPIDKALDEIASLRGRQFDPELTDHFLALVRRLARENEDLDAYLGKAARNSPFLKARAKIKEMLAQGRDSAALSIEPPPPGTPVN